ncbi:MAG: hypothetical protein A3G38_00680 [Omnitrophica WOR_2 bacterium RIFCSPLOWO2_12_FULL_51_8]|nr:MAG: hypothetical protein A3G38_00680 [Omnitrophica WOR_2 bacterium RIFCSPLOWO2_12_FULL_51_8]
MSLTRKAFFNLVFIIIFTPFCFAQEQQQDTKAEGAQAEAPKPETAIVDDLNASENVTLDFKEADIRNVLKIISYKAGVNIITTPEVIGNVTIRLVDVPWENALEAILKTYGFSYEKQGNIILVAPIEKLTAQKRQEVELAQVQPTLTEVFNLKFIDALDAKKALEPQLSPRGKITILEMTGQAGWEFGGGALGARKRKEEEKLSRSKILIVSDISPVMDKIKDAIEKIDVMQKQVIIEARIMEVSRDKLRDIGIDYGTGSGGAESATITPTPAKKKGGVDISQIGGHIMNLATPSVFSPKAGITAANTGLQLLFKNLSGAQFEIVLHALEEDVHTNTLSAPRILAMNNQEANILIGTRYPILKSEITGAGSTAITTVTLDYYQDIGIQLNVMPQIGIDDYINLVVHPAVTSYSSSSTIGGTNAYPIIESREAETRVMLKDGETMVIAGLLKDVKSKDTSGIPFLSKIPIAGALFRRDTYDNTKIDLLIFITTHVVKDESLSVAELARMEKEFEEAAREGMNGKNKKRGK